MFPKGETKMNSYSKYLQERKIKDLQYFFGESTQVLGSAKDTVKWNRIIDNDNIVIVTSNIRVWKEQYVLIVDNNKVVYLKSWQVKLVKNWDFGINAYAVKLNRSFFKPYTTKFEIEDVSFDREDTFDSLLEVAKEQNDTNVSWKLGHYNF